MSTLFMANTVFFVTVPRFLVFKRFSFYESSLCTYHTNVMLEGEEGKARCGTFVLFVL